ncbi:MAG: vitamin K epoxide reductase family protein, partial [Nitrososphaerota archaeon]|nr:vitamin K epoxide reductase family protein [Nitrososphaerota archaeon]
MQRRISWKKFSVLMIMSVIGLWASTMVLVIYNTLHHSLPACTLPSSGSGGIVVNCDKVLGSSYSSIDGVPLEVFAVVYFIVNLALIYLIGFGTDSIYKAAFKTLFVWRFLGICIVPYLIVVELFLVKAICLYCTTMHAAIIIDFIIISYFLYYKKSLLSYTSMKVNSTLEENRIE